MYQPDISAYLDAIKQQYDTVVAENKSLKQENIRLAEANGQYIRKMQYYMNVFNRQMCSEGLSPSRPAKCLKRGSDWFVDGDRLCVVSMREKIAMPMKITNAVASRCGRYVAFASSHRVFVLVGGDVYFLNAGTEKMEEYDGGMFRDQEYRLCAMDFTADSQYLYVGEGGMARMWSMAKGVQERAFKCSDAVAMRVVDSLLFVAGRDKTLGVYDDGRLVASLSSMDEFNGPMAVGLNGDYVYAVVGKNKIVVVDVKAEKLYLTNTGEERVLAMAMSPENMAVCVGGYSRMAAMYRMKSEKPLCRLQESIEQKSPVLALDFIGDVLVVGQHEGLVMWDVKQKKSMRVHMNESNVIGLSVCRDFFTTVDNNGVLRLWNYHLGE